MQTKTNAQDEISSELKLRSKAGLHIDRESFEEMLQKVKGQGTPAEHYYKTVLKQIDTELEERAQKKKKPEQNEVHMPVSALKKLCTMYAPTLKFSKEALTFLEEIIKIETCQVFKRLKTLAGQRGAKTIKKQDLKALAEMNVYD